MVNHPKILFTNRPGQIRICAAHALRYEIHKPGTSGYSIQFFKRPNLIYEIALMPKIGYSMAVSHRIDNDSYDYVQVHTFVKEDCRRNGYAKKLLNHLMARTKYEAYIVEYGSDAGVNMYHKFGFKTNQVVKREELYGICVT